MIQFITKRRSSAIKSCLSIGVFAILSLSAVPTFASGGGGGGGSSGGDSAPQYDPVKEYQNGINHLDAKEYKKAKRAFSRVLSVARKDANTNYLMGMSYTGMENPKKAARYYKSAVKYNSNLSAAHIALAQSYLDQGRADKAQKVLSDLENLLAKCAGCTGQAALEKAKTGVSALLSGSSIVQESSYITHNQSHIDLAYFESVSLINQARYDEAIVQLGAIATANGPHPDIMNYLGYAHRKLGQYSQAEAYYNIALAVDPDHKGANEYLGELYVETGQLEKAKTQLARLETICTFGCVEENELRGWIADLAP
ncbi:MAG: tetratricopeptide repeat protein [Robiginitomaculum sp.]|nr:tetratricopeptide repeat protein [Robiginitomaculum sp.]